MYMHSSYATSFCNADFQLIVSCKHCPRYVCKSRNIVLNMSKVNCDEMDTLGSMIMPETLLITKAFD